MASFTEKVEKPFVQSSFYCRVVTIAKLNENQWKYRYLKPFHDKIKVRMLVIFI